MNSEFDNVQTNNSGTAKKKGLPYIILGAALIVLIIVAALVLPKMFNKDNDEIVNLFNENLVCVKKGDEWGYVNKKGKWVIKAQYKEAYAFADNGLALVCDDDGEYGYIDTKGKMVIKAKYTAASGFYENGLAVVLKDDEWGAINKKGETVVDFKYAYIGEFNEHGTAVVGKAEDDGTILYGVVDSKGELVFPTKYEDIENPNGSGCTVAMKDGEWGVLKKNGEWAKKPKFDSATAFDDFNLARVEIDGEYGIINTKGEEVLAVKYEAISAFSEDDGLAFFKQDGEVGIVNTKGKIVLEAEFDDVFAPFKDGKAIVMDGTDYILINKKGEEIFEFDDCRPVGHYADNGLILVQEIKKTGDGKFGYLNEKGDVVIDYDYKAAGNFADNDLAVVFDGKEYGYINKSGKEVISPEYDGAVSFFNDGFTYVRKYDAEKEEEKFIIINEKGKEIFECDGVRYSEHP